MRYVTVLAVTMSLAALILLSLYKFGILSGDALGIGLVVGIAVAGVLLWSESKKSRTCPNCNASLPGLRAPANLRQLMLGGWSCPKCGAEIDRSGKLVTTD